MGQGRRDYGATSMILHSFATRLDACNLEDNLQLQLDTYPLGHRLHRHVAMGSNVDGTDSRLTNPDYLVHVFVTVFPIEKPPVNGLMTTRTNPPRTLRVVL